MQKGLPPLSDKNFLIYCKQVGNDPLLTRQEEVSLAEQIHGRDLSAADQAREKLTKANLRLVVKVAKQYNNLGLDMTDLISEGNIGLMQAVEKFNPLKGVKFSTYACYWIKQSIKRALSNKSRTIRLPIHLTQLQYTISNFVKKFEVRNSREPTDKEIASSLNVSIKKIKNTKSAYLLNNFTFLDAKLDEDGGEENFAIVENLSATNPFLAALENDDKDILMKEMRSVLDEREHYIIQRRFGLGNLDCHTLEQLGVRYGITRERIRQIEAEALKKLRRKLEKKM